jgi:hypothetical protein
MSAAFDRRGDKVVAVLVSSTETREKALGTSASTTAYIVDGTSAATSQQKFDNLVGTLEHETYVSPKKRYRKSLAFSSVGARR